MSFSSSALSIARTRICRTTARASLGEISSGGLWQRPQFVWKRFSPSVGDAGAVLAGFGFEFFGEGFLLVCAMVATHAPQEQMKTTEMSFRCFIWILRAKAETGTDK